MQLKHAKYSPREEPAVPAKTKKKNVTAVGEEEGRFEFWLERYLDYRMFVRLGDAKRK